MIEGLILIAVSLVLIWISRDAAAMNRDVELHLILQNYRHTPRIRRFFLRLFNRTEGLGRWYGWLVGALGVVGGIILIVRDL